MKATAGARKKPATPVRQSRGKPRCNDISATDSNDQRRLDMPSALLALIDEHQYTSRLLPLLEGEATKLGDRQQAVNFDCLESIMHYLLNYPDLFHHPREDLIFARMAEREERVKTTVARLQRDHQKMAGHGQDLYDRIVHQRKRNDLRKARSLSADILDYASALREHMQCEEREVLLRAWHCLTVSEWEEIDNATQSVEDPIFGSQVAAQYVVLMQRYISEFNAIPSTGAFPIRLVETAAGSIEKIAYTFGELNRLPRRLIRTSWNISRDRARRVRSLTRVRNLSDLGSWARTTSTEYVNDWQRLSRELTKTLSFMGQAVTDDATFIDPHRVTLNTEEQLLAFQTKPYAADENPRVSWQAAVMNLTMRLTYKPLMEHLPRLAMENNRAEKCEPPGTRVTRVQSSHFRATWLIPREVPETRRTILHLHGGGFIIPASEMHMKMLAKLAEKSASRALLLHYRLLPEHAFPAGLEDAMAAYKFLLEQGVAAEEIVISGDSAGGNLALALLMSIRDEGWPMPAAGVVMSPCTDLTFSTRARSINRWRDALLPGLVKKKSFYDHYAGELSVEHPLISPIFGDYREFPRMFAIVSSSETLLDDTLVVARRARSQGVDFEVDVWSGLPHVWPLYDFMPEADLALDHMAAFIEGQFKATFRKNPVSLPVYADATG